MCSTCPVKAPIAYVPSMAVARPAVVNPVGAYAAVGPVAPTNAGMAPVIAPSIKCTPNPITNTQIISTPSTNRLGGTSGLTVVASPAAAQYCAITDLNGRSLAPTIPTQFVPNRSLPFTYSGTLNPNSDQVMQTQCVVSGYYIPPQNSIQASVSGLSFTPGYHTFIKAGVVTMLNGNLVATSTGITTRAFTISIPVPGLPPSFLTGPVTATILSGGTTPNGVAMAQADVLANNSTIAGPEFIGIQIILPNGDFSIGDRLDIGYALSYQSNPQQ